MRTRLLAVACIVAALSAYLAPSAPSAQTGPPARDPQQPTFRAGTNFVRVDMYATTDGRPVEDLAATDVEILEDGVRQTIDQFEHVRVAPAGSQDQRVEPNSVSESRQMAADPRARVFVIFLDTYHTQIEGSATMRQPLLRFIDRVLGPDDLVAVMTPEMSASDVTFGRKTTVISNMLQSNWTWGRRGRLVDDDATDRLYDACFGSEPTIAQEMKARRREKLTLDALEDLVVHLNGIREERKAVLAVTEGWLLFRENPSLARTTGGTNRVGLPPDTFTRGRTERGGDRGTVGGDSAASCEADRVALANLDHTFRLNEITEDANRANVSFYPVYARGLVAFDAPIGPDRPPPLSIDTANFRTRQDALRLLSDGTDGLAVINTNQIDAALKRIVDDVSSYYLLGYSSTNTKLDGRFRNITVRVARPGVQVRARRGYRGLTAGELVRGVAPADPAAPANPVINALNAVAFNPRAPFRIRASSWAGCDRCATQGGDVTTAPVGDRVGVSPDGGTATAQGNVGAFWIVGELDAATRTTAPWTAGGSAEITIVAADGKQILSSTAPVQALNGGFALRVPEHGHVPSGEYAVRVRLRAASDRGTELSDIARVVVPAIGSGLGEAVLWRRGPFTGVQYLRTADPRFRRTERLRFELATTAAGMASARLLDRDGKVLLVPVQVTERADESGQFRWIVADATLAPLAPGEYAVEVALGDARQVTAFRLVP